ncbi:MAG: pectate lyase [Acidobacteria bacterium]|nr:MAG: pectate lyase [Acidobacteriota bacterium]
MRTKRKTLLFGVVALLANLGPGQRLPAAKVRWTADILERKADWYGSREARAIADNVLGYQSPEGGWPKNTDLAASPPPPSMMGQRLGDSVNTIDNGATTTPMCFLARVGYMTGEVRYLQAVVRGFDYLIAAQYPNGGWPQFFPLRQGYYSHITYNDNAMVNVLSLLGEIAAWKWPYSFFDHSQRLKAGAAISRAIDCILRTQVKQGGKLTGWCAQHDEKTLQPAWARNFEPPSISGAESVGIVRFLMEIDEPTPREIAAVEGAVAWFRAVAIPGLRLEGFTGADGKPDRRVVRDPNAKPLWARFYELGTNRPIFTGRDKIIRYTLSEIEHERRNGYAYYGDWPATLLGQDYPRWREKHKVR